MLARHLGSPGGLVVAHSIFTVRALWIGICSPPSPPLRCSRRLRADGVTFGGLRITVADVAALGALGAILLALARGKADATALQASGGTGVFLLLLPGLVLFVLAVVAARLLSPALRLLELAARRATPPVRVALLSLARAPGEVSLTVVFFVLSVGIAVFAFAYRAHARPRRTRAGAIRGAGAVRAERGSRQARHDPAGGGRRSSTDRDRLYVSRAT